MSCGVVVALLLSCLVLIQEIDLATYKANMDKVTPRSLYLLIAVLLTTGTLSMEDLLKRVSPGIISLAAKEK